MARAVRHRSFRLTTVLALCFATGVIASACDDEDLDRLEPALRFEPDKMDFGTRAIGRSHTLSVEAISSGSADLRISGVRIEPSSSPFVINSFPEFLGIGQRAEVSATFTPGAQGLFEAAAVFFINSDSAAEQRLAISGEVGPPRIEVVPAQLDFGLVNQDTGHTLAVRVNNVGDDWLQIRSLTFGDVDTEFSLASGSLEVGDAIDPGDYALLHIKYVPNDTGDDNDVLSIGSNASNGPNTDVALSARGNLSPVVVALEEQSNSAELTVDPEAVLTLISTGTYDPEGAALSLQWQLIERPVGSNARLPSAETTTATTHLALDIVGDYVARLTAIDDNGARGWADVSIHAIRDLVVRLTWDTAADAPCRSYSEDQCANMSLEDRQRLCCGQTDVDIHLVAPGGSVGDYLGACPGSTCDTAICGGTGTCSATQCACVDTQVAACGICRSQGLDCAYANRNPDWGELGSRLDDPRLDLDDVRGLGPEMISLNNPVDGAYLVYVHYCNDRLNAEPTDTTVQVFIKGRLEHSIGPQRLSAQHKLWLAAILTKSGEDWIGTTPGSVSDAEPDLCSR